MNQPTCGGVTKHGERCRSFAPLGRDYCLAHDPERAADVAAARSRGGTVATALRSLRGKRVKLDTAAGLVRFTAGVVQDTLGGQLEPDIARVVLYGVSIQKSLVETADHERRLAELERRHGQAGRATR